MTKEQFDKAAVLMNELKNLENVKSSLQFDIARREEQLRRYPTHYHVGEWLREQVARFNFDGKKASITVRYEGSRPVEFPVDEGFVGTVLMYLDAQIEKKSKELREL